MKMQHVGLFTALFVMGCVLAPVAQGTCTFAPGLNYPYVMNRVTVSRTTSADAQKAAYNQSLSQLSTASLRACVAAHPYKYVAGAQWSAETVTVISNTYDASSGYWTAVDQGHAKISTCEICQ